MNCAISQPDNMGLDVGREWARTACDSPQPSPLLPIIGKSPRACMHVSMGERAHSNCRMKKILSDFSGFSFVVMVVACCVPLFLLDVRATFLDVFSSRSSRSVVGTAELFVFPTLFLYGLWLAVAVHHCHIHAGSPQLSNRDLSLNPPRPPPGESRTQLCTITSALSNNRRISFFSVTS